MSAPVDTTPRRSLLRDRNMAVLFAGETVSELGSTMTFLVFPLIAIGLGASPFMVGVIAAATNAAWLVVALPAGAWVDRVRQRPILIATDIGSAALLVSVPVASAWHVLTVAQLVIIGLRPARSASRSTSPIRRSYPASCRRADSSTATA
jgi:MFS family permease